MITHDHQHARTIRSCEVLLLFLFHSIVTILFYDWNTIWQRYFSLSIFWLRFIWIKNWNGTIQNHTKIVFRIFFILFQSFFSVWLEDRKKDVHYAEDSWINCLGHKVRCTLQLCQPSLPFAPPLPISRKYKRSKRIQFHWNLSRDIAQQHIWCCWNIVRIAM